MRYNCKDLGFHFEMNNDNYIALNNEGKIKFFNMGEEQLKQNLFIFMEVNENKFTGKYFQINLDGGYYPTLEDVKKGQDLCVENIKKFVPGMKLISEVNLMPQNIRKCVWERSDGSMLSQYFMSKNGYLFCVAGDISREDDALDNLMASVCMSVTAETQSDLNAEERQKLMIEVTEEVNRLVDSGIPADEAMSMAFEKFGIKRN